MWWMLHGTIMAPAKGAEDWDNMFENDVGIERLADELELNEPDSVQDIVDLDYNGGLPPYEENK